MSHGITILSDSEPKVLEIIHIPGIGLQGPSGAAGAAHIHTQASASASWVINHDLGFEPDWTVNTDQYGIVIPDDIIHHSVNQTEIQFFGVRTGTARGE